MSHKNLRNETETETEERHERDQQRIKEANSDEYSSTVRMWGGEENDAGDEVHDQLEDEVDDVLGALLRLCERTTNVGAVATRHAAAQANALTRIARALERIADQVAPDTLTRKP